MFICWPKNKYEIQIIFSPSLPVAIPTARIIGSTMIFPRLEFFLIISIIWSSFFSETITFRMYFWLNCGVNTALPFPAWTSGGGFFHVLFLCLLILPHFHFFEIFADCHYIIETQSSCNVNHNFLEDGLSFIFFKFEDFLD